MLRIVNGDLLDAKEEYICQQTNCISVRAHGLSETIRMKLGIDPYSHRRQLNNKNYAIPEDHDIPGTIKIYGKVICMFAQYGMGKPYKYGNKVEDSRFDISEEMFLEKRLLWFNICLFEVSKLNPKSVAFPYNIGCGLVGGNWKDYLDAITHFSTYFNIPVTLYKL